ncbi:HD domain-containing phosphohydrolase [Rhodocyclus tenuis]|uniref:Putative two-component system response regulator n=1 Tax=Rhodocyclus tenuis TaxID=1066 RepID=A0A840G7G2_RHOTE|nr:HD domain-containing phosphohydrolase [Rhodocyclus tenuis]MBB4247825.1 putative two-component system response regulator [Rhodocyclus tenuis]
MNIKPNAARILVVDDEPANLKLVDKMLRKDGYENVVLIQNPHEVLAACMQERTDLILLDINMPDLDGFAVMAQLLALNDPLLPPIVVLTAQDRNEVMLRAFSEGARDFICKPFGRYELLARVRNLLDVHLAHRLLHEQKTVLAEMVDARTSELHHSRLQIVRVLGRAAEYRDNETGAHVMRVSHVAELLARVIGWNEAQCELILNASPMHDIGKIGISDLILLKPGPLSVEERTIMQTHAEIGARILEARGNAILEMAGRIAYSHHEKWDGTGYPAGLRGEEIPLEARIVAIADVFDSLMSVRPYKQAWSVDAATRFMRDNAGSHFDPVLVGHFLDTLPQILEIRERFRDSPLASALPA